METYGNHASYDDRMITPEEALSTGLVRVEAIPQPASELGKRLDGEVLNNMYEAWEQAKQPEIHEQHIASRYYHSKQWTDAELKELKRRRQPVTTKNRIKRKVDFLVGVEQRLRRDPKCYPRTPAAEKAANVSTACLRSVEDETKWQAIASYATKDALIRGIGVVWCGAQIIKGRAEVRKKHIPSDRFFYDPCSEAHDFSDARYLGEWQWMDMDQAAEMLPFAAEMIDELSSAQYGGSLSTLPQEFERSLNWHTWIDTHRRMIRITFIWYKCRGKWMFDYLVGPVSLCPQDYDCTSPYVDEDGLSIQPYCAWSPYIDESLIRYGVIRDMMSLQDEINKRSSKMLWLLSVRQTMGERGAVDDVDRMKTEAVRGDGHIEYNKGFEFQFVDQSPQTQGQFELLQEAKAEIENLGPNPGLIGRGVEKQSGRAILAQQNSGMTELSPVFENLREWKLAVYHRDWSLIRQFWNGERIVRVTSDPKAVEFLNINRIIEDPMTGRVSVENAIMDMDVDVILDEGPDTVTMREELLEQLAQLGPGAVPPELLIELSAIAEKDVVLKRLQEMKAPPPEMIQLQERMAQLEQALKAVDVDKGQAEVENKRADTIKKLVEAGAPPHIIQTAFPIHYREPTFLDKLQMASMSADQAAQNPMAGPQPGPEGEQVPPNALIEPPMPDPFAGGEPQINQPGGLPLGAGVQ